VEVVVGRFRRRLLSSDPVRRGRRRPAAAKASHAICQPHKQVRQRACR
jgi:hypothetical protein